jgi:TolB-like protein/DNA-binding winged helix-turn-helix (wHTH) protein/Tfp pilus assembly protein PilF
MISKRKHFYEFGPFRVDPVERILWRDRQTVPLQPKAFDTLLALVENSDRVVLKEDLMKTVWPDTFVEESNLTQNIFVLRKALGETAGEHRYIITLPGRGYRLAGEVRTVPALETGPVEESSQPPQALDKVPQDKRPWSAVRALSVAVGIIVVLAAGYLAWRQFRPHAPSGPGRIMLAVLPFSNLTGDAEQEYLADGLTEEMITQLGRLDPEQLGVIARTSVMPYKEGSKGLDQIGRELGVQYVLEGSIRGAADRLRITAQLIQLRDQSHVWAEEYDRPLRDILNVQEEVGAAVTREIQLRLTPQQQAGKAGSRTIDPEAYEAYLKGLFFYNQRNREGLEKAVGFFQMAITRTPGYAPAYAALADAYVALGYYGLEEQNDTIPKARAAAQKAIEIDENLSEAYVSLGAVSEQYDWNWREAERDYKRAIELNPNNALAHHSYGAVYLSSLGRFPQAVGELRKAHELDPMSPITNTALAIALCLSGRSEEGREQFRKTFEIVPDFVQAHYYLAEVDSMTNSYPEALAELEKIKSTDAVPANGLRGYVYAMQGRRREALQIVDGLQRIAKPLYVDPVLIANIYAGLGEKDLAFTWLDKAYRQHSAGMITLKQSPVYDRLRSDPRFVDLLRRVGIP